MVNSMAGRASEIDDELRTIWNRKLYHWWHHYNEEYLAARMKPPLIELSLAARTLGQWDRGHRRISVSAEHVRRDSWMAVMDTLRHEMAHQYVDEILQVEDETPHSAAFAQACRQLRCSPRAAATQAEREGEDERLLRVIKKVLSLAASPNEHEAQVAVEKARRLLLEYNVDVVALDRERGFGSRCLGPIKGRRSSWELWLAMILNEFFFVEVLWTRSYDAPTDKDGTILTVYGTATNLEMAEYVYDYLSQLLRRLWPQYVQTAGIRGNRERQRYFAGVLQGFHGKLAERERRAPSVGSDLVWLGDSRLVDYYRYHNPRVVTRTTGGVVASDAYRDGVDEGRRVTIHPPVAGATVDGGLLVARGNGRSG
jgi:hypothetical protein